MFVKGVLQSLWTTAPAFKLDFAGSSGVVTPVEPTDGFEQRRFNRCYPPDDPAKSNLNAGAVVQRDCKTPLMNTG